MEGGGSYSSGVGRGARGSGEGAPAGPGGAATKVKRRRTTAAAAVSAKEPLPTELWRQLWNSLTDEDRTCLVSSGITRDKYTELGSRIDFWHLQWNGLWPDRNGSPDGELPQSVLDTVEEAIQLVQEELPEDSAGNPAVTKENMNVPNKGKEVRGMLWRKGTAPLKALKNFNKFSGNMLPLAGNALFLAALSTTTLTAVAAGVAAAGSAIPAAIGVIVVGYAVFRAYRDAEEFCKDAVHDFMWDLYECGCNILWTLRMLLVFPYQQKLHMVLRKGDREAGILPAWKNAVHVVQTCAHGKAKPFAAYLVRALEREGGKAAQNLKDSRRIFGEDMVPVYADIMMREKQTLMVGTVMVGMNQFRSDHIKLNLEVREQLDKAEVLWELLAEEFRVNRAEIETIRGELMCLKSQRGCDSARLGHLEARISEVEQLPLREQQEKLKEIRQEVTGMSEELLRLQEESARLAKEMARVQDEVASLQGHQTQQSREAECEKEDAVERRRVPDQAQDMLLRFDDPERPEAKLERGLLDGAKKMFGVVGMAGVGKTSICIALSKSEKVNSHFEMVAWLSYGPSISSQDAVSCMRDLLKLMWRSGEPVIKAEGHTTDLLVGPLRRSLNFRKVLVVLDDVWESFHVKDLVEAVVTAQGESAVVISGRNREVMNDAGKEVVIEDVKELDMEDAIAVLKRRKERTSLVREVEDKGTNSETWGDVDEKKAKEILNLVGRLPLLVAALGGMIGAGKMDWDGLLRALTLARDNPFHEEITRGTAPGENSIERRESVSMVMEVGLERLEREYYMNKDDAKGLRKNYERLLVLPNKALVDLDSLALLWHDEDMARKIEKEVDVLVNLNLLTVVREEGGRGNGIVVTIHDAFLWYLRVREKRNLSRYHADVLQRLVDATPGEFRPTDESGRTRILALVEGAGGGRYKYIAENSTWHVFYALDTLMRDEQRSLAEDVMDLRDEFGQNVLYFGEVFRDRAGEMDEAVEGGLFTRIIPLEGDWIARFITYHVFGYTPLHAFCAAQSAKSICALFEYVMRLATSRELPPTMGMFSHGAVTHRREAAVWLMKLDRLRGWSPLHYCCHEQGEEVVEKVLDMGRDVLSKEEFGKWLMQLDDLNGMSALHCCCQNQREEVVKKMLDMGRDVLSKKEFGKWLMQLDDLNGSSALHYCCYQHGEEVVKKVLDMGWAVLSNKEFGRWLMQLGKTNGLSALHRCCARQGEEVVKKVLDMGRTVLSPGEFRKWLMQLGKTSGSSALHLCCYQQEEEMVTKVLDMGRAVMLDEDFRKWLMQLDRLNGMSALHCCCQNQREEVVKKMLDMGRDVLSKEEFGKWLMQLDDLNGSSALHYCCYQHGEEAVKKVLDIGWAVLSRKEFARWLMQLGKTNGLSALHRCCQNQREEVVKKMLDMGRDVLSKEEFGKWLTQKDAGGMSALHYCRQNQREEVVKKVLDIGRDVLSKEEFGKWLMQLDDLNGSSALN